MKNSIKSSILTTFLVAAATIGAAPRSQGATFVIGDIFAAIGDGNVSHFSSAGALKATYNIGAGGFTTGMAFDGDGNLYVTGFSANTLAKFDTNGNLVNANFASGLSTPESVVFDSAGNLYVGNLGNGIRKYNSGGSFEGTVINTRVDFFDLSADQSTFVYGQEGNVVKTVSNGTPGTSGPDFASGLSNAFAMRFLPDGGLLVADMSNVKRFNSAGSLIQTYDASGEDTWFSLNLDPDGTSFFSGNFNTGNVYKFDIETGNELFDFNAIPSSQRLFGLAVFGEVTEGGPPPPTNGVPEGGSILWIAVLGLCTVSRWARRKNS